MIRAILTDIEGTTTSLSFVKDVLFPYARAGLAAFVAARRDDAEVRALLEDVRALAGENLTDEQVVAQLVEWIDQDRKITPLKTLQGMLWEEGYRRGDFQGHVYADADRRLREWAAAGIRLFVFSSGSVQAQKLLFGHSSAGDLTPLFTGYFDTRIGAKGDPDAYRAIAREIRERPADVLFLSDITAELDAARVAGMATCQLVRDGEPAAGAAHPQARDFDGVRF